MTEESRPAQGAEALLCARLLTAIEEAGAIKRSLVNSAAIEEQTISVIRRLTDRFKEREENITRMSEKIDALVEQVHLMARHFHTLEERLDDSIHCPMNPVGGQDGPKSDER